MRRNVKILVLAAGVVLGYGSGIAGLCAHRRHRDGFERHVARLCVEAARHPDAPPPPPRRW